MTRLAIFKRKQSTPERLIGRELLRRYGFISGEEGIERKELGSDGLLICDYNVKFCTQCPDCIAYGFAIGDAGSEKSKVITDTSYSLTSYEHSHEAFTLNAPFEDGTMTRHGKTTSRISEQDHVSPQVIFPQSAWGGFKSSGIGRELGPWGLHAYLGVKHFTVRNGDSP